MDDKGIPLISKKGFDGNLVEPNLVGINPKTLIMLMSNLHQF